jgi:DNA invertase Pin-like site-specific DNA recombinase
MRRRRGELSGRVESRAEEIAATGEYAASDLIDTMRLLVFVARQLDRLELAAMNAHQRRRRHERVSLSYLFAATRGVESADSVTQAIIQDIAEIGRQVLSERVREGMARAKAAGGRGPGRPATDVTVDVVQKLYAEGMSFREIARVLSTSRMTVHRRFVEGARRANAVETGL